MNESEIRILLRDVIGEATYPPALTDRVATRIQRPTSAPRPTRWLALIAGALAVVIVMSLVYVRAHSVGPVRRSANSTPIPPEVMQRTFLNPVAGLISRPDIQVRLGDRTITLVAAYADPVQLALIFRVLPATQGLVIRVLDDVGAVIPVGNLMTGPDGFQYTPPYSGPHAGADGKAHLQTILADAHADVIAATPVRFTSPQTTFSFDLKVWPAAPLAVVQGPITVGTWKVTIETFERTPLWIYMFAVIAGAPRPTGNSFPWIWDTIVLFDGHGTRLTLGNSEAEWGLSSHHPSQWELNLRWYAPAEAETYTLAITGGGGSYTASVRIPARPTS